MAMINFYGVFGLALVTRGGNVGRLLLWSWFVNLVLLVLLPPPLGLEKKVRGS